MTSKSSSQYDVEFDPFSPMYGDSLMDLTAYINTTPEMLKEVKDLEHKTETRQMYSGPSSTDIYLNSAEWPTINASTKVQKPIVDLKSEVEHIESVEQKYEQKYNEELKEQIPEMKNNKETATLKTSNDSNSSRTM